jgi:hypothetical protein
VVSKIRDSDVVDIWTGRRAIALQKAMRLSNEAFARKLGIAIRTVAGWHDSPEIEPSSVNQEALDTLFERAPEAVRLRFALLVGTLEPLGGLRDATIHPEASTAGSWGGRLSNCGYHLDG